MGTRSLTCVILGGVFKVAQYCQWDGYPNGQGKTTLKFCQETDMEAFADKVAKCSWITEAERKAAWAAVGVMGETASMEQSEALKQRYPNLHRDTGAKVLNLIMASEGLVLADQHAFAADGLFCEWAYVLDLDAGNLEVYEGFQETVCEGRFKPLDKGGEYRPVTLKKTYPLADLPHLETFLTDLEEPELELAVTPEPSEANEAGAA